MEALMGTIIRGDVVESTDVLVPESGSDPLPAKKKEEAEKKGAEATPPEGGR